MERGHGVVAAVAVAAVGACLGLIIYAGERMYESIGPSKAVALPDGSLYLVSHGAIHRFGADGKRRDAIDLGALGLTLKPSDLAVHRDGRVVVASPDGAELDRCDLSTRSCERIDPKLTQVPLQHSLPLNSVKVAIDDDRARYYLSDNAGHRVVATDFAGKRIAASKRGAFAYPNQLALEAGNVLRVVDTNHHRVAMLDASGDALDREVGAMPTAAAGIARAGRDWPFDALRTPAGETWALVADGGMKDADLIVYDATGKAVKRIDLGDDSDPFDIELWGDRVLVADATNYRVQAVSLDGRVANAFDDPAFAAELERAHDVPGLWRAARLAAQVGIGLVPLIAIVVLRHMGAPMGLARTAPPVPAAPPEGAKLSREIRWVAIDPGYFDAVQRRVVRGMIPSVVIMVITFALTWYLFGEQLRAHGRMRDFTTPAIGIVAMFAFVPFIGHITRRQLGGYRLGASMAGLHYDFGRSAGYLSGSRSGVAPWREVYYDGKRILAGRKVLMTASPRGDAMFDAAALQREILPYVPKANFVSPGRLAWLAFTAYGPMAWLLLFVLIALAFGVVYVG